MALIPEYRFALRGKIHERGFKKLQDFAAEIGVNKSTISRVLNGWEFPCPSIQDKFSKRLDLTDTELMEML